MTTQVLLRKIFLRVGKFKFLIAAFTLAMGLLFFFYGRTRKIMYTASSTVFPLTASSDNSAASTALSNILGISEAPKSFSQEASINIVELALSRNTREAVASEKLPQFGNKSIAELLIETYNNNKAFWEKAVKMPKTEQGLYAVGADILKFQVTAKINKNGVLEINYGNINKDLVSPVSYAFIDKISEFYKELKIKKARLDYEFTLKKIDSLDKVLESFDEKAIALNNTTLFVPSEKIQYSIPKENLASQKQWVANQREASANNREEALWRLQKNTPIIATLDKPDPPFEESKTSSVLLGIVGVVLGFVIITFILIAKTLYQYAKEEVYNMVFGDEKATSGSATS
ncbi:MAG: hypothetical protein IT254_12105 [Chitinophagaceae bacterium]|nr:hypothetical protein [Chitinophagaceae bacterium]MCW5916538.1 hypothetical protein [Ferruginibacter sp.]